MYIFTHNIRWSVSDTKKWHATALPAAELHTVTTSQIFRLEKTWDELEIYFRIQCSQGTARYDMQKFRQCCKSCLIYLKDKFYLLLKIYDIRMFTKYVFYTVYSLWNYTVLLENFEGIL